jgi:hypothetical protein
MRQSQILDIFSLSLYVNYNLYVFQANLCDRGALWHYFFQLSQNCFSHVLRLGKQDGDGVQIPDKDLVPMI